MQILIADDDWNARNLLEALLQGWGHEVIAVGDGIAAWETLRKADGPDLAILDAMMPGLDGMEVCRQARAQLREHPLYIILLTALASRADTLQGFEAGANDYITKPCDPAEFRARVNVGASMGRLQRELSARVHDLEHALANVDQLHGILPICAYCKKVRSDAESWQEVEAYVAAHSAVRFSHGACPGCMETVVKEQLLRARVGSSTREKSSQF